MRPALASPQPVERDEFKASMSRWASGVTVVTTTDPAGRHHGFTASSFTAVSMVPPMVLVCLDRDAVCAPAFARSPWLGIHVLRRGQEPLARRFARKDPDKFAGVELTRAPGIGGVPLLTGVLARLECQVVSRVDGGDHVILVAEVRRAYDDGQSAGDPLVYYHRTFHQLGGGPARPAQGQ
ncbi:flavin reductase family protein [Streptomyces polygonati]|uniref:Flavin reductase family protein n=1 Tax=Streptomyces polygonati TaxID=1617087 RepID=A0ABV8HMU3_9ACTN